MGALTDPLVSGGCLNTKNDCFGSGPGWKQELPAALLTALKAHNPHNKYKTYALRGHRFKQPNGH